MFATKLCEKKISVNIRKDKMFQIALDLKIIPVTFWSSNEKNKTKAFLQSSLLENARTRTFVDLIFLKQT